MALLFLRRPGGVSHHPDECVLVQDVIVALDVMVRYLDLLANRIGSEWPADFPRIPIGEESLEWNSSVRRAAASGAPMP
jgi:hypothetical protein